MKRKSNLNLLILNSYLNIFIYTIFFSFIIIARAQSQISLIIEGSGNQALLNETFNKEPTVVIVNGVIQSSCKKSCNLQNRKNNITLKFNDYITSCDNMFYGMNNIIEIDLSNFHTQQVTSMCCMFRECTKLASITFGNIVTSKVNDMQSIFRDCTKITSIDVSKFDTSSLTNTLELFSHCESLISMDLKNFKTQNVVNTKDLFAYCYKLISFDLSSFDTRKVTNMQGMFFYCRKLKYLYLENFSANSLNHFWYVFTNCESLIFLNLRNFKISREYEVALHDTFRDHPTTTKYCIEDSYTINKFLSDKTVDCSNFCFQKNIDIDFENDKCICNENYKFEFNNICYQSCPQNTYPILIEKYTCINPVPENYYLDNIDKINKKCYDRCKTCNQSGNENFHNCNECLDDYRFLNDSFAQENNCYNICQYYYYFDENNQYKCTQNYECPSNYNLLIDSRNKCIDDCKKDSDYIFEYNNKCLIQCPDNFKFDVDTKHCLEECNENQITFDNMCYNEFPENSQDFFKGGSILIKNTTNFDDFLKNKILSSYQPEVGNNLIIERPDEIVYQITNSINELDFLKNKSKNVYNISIIDL